MGFHLGGTLFRNTFGTPEMREIFDETGYIDRFLQFEAALARAEADVGLVPPDAAADITRRASVEYVDTDEVARNLEAQGLLSMSIIDAWKEELGEAGEYVHWGATSQDAMDTAVMLQVRDAFEVLMDDVAAIQDLLVDLVADHADTPMMGRTHHVHAIPTTFGLKAATWLDELDRRVERLRRARENVVGQFAGAVGTFASLGEDGPAVRDRLEEELDLSIPVVWHAARDRFADLLSAFSVLASTLARIALQVLVLNREEIGELGERVAEGAVGSSTMPHKRNPKRAETVVGLARLLRGNAHVMTEVMETFDERSASSWYVEFAVVPESFLYVGRAVANARSLIESLEVDAEAMRENLTVHGSLVASEPIMMALAEELGRQTAHSVVYEHAMAAAESEESFLDRLQADDRVTDAVPPAELAELADPTDYTGVAEELALEVLSERGSAPGN
jgi:3-carboxy-cis,cis-muconate cycloisomerase